MSSRIPLNIITGFLGVGKTTSVLNLLANKPANERWAVLVNEFGKVAIDNKTLESNRIGDVEIKEVAGGCICCSANTPFVAALATLVFKIKPQRIIIEPSGLAFLSSLDEALQSERIKAAIDLKSTLCLADANQIKDFRIQNNETYKAQMQVSDVILINKTDITTTDVLERFSWWMTENIGPKQYIGKTVNGKIDPDLLDLEPTRELTKVNKPGSHFMKSKKWVMASPTEGTDGQPEPGKPLKIFNDMSEFHAFGLVFSPVDRFDKVKLYQVLSEIPALRLKGIFQTPQGNFLYNRINDYFSVLPLSESTDSRVEMIVFKDSIPDYTTIQEKITRCLS